MSFVERAINVQFTMAEQNGTLNANSDNVLQLSGYRVEAVIDYPGRLGLESMHLRIWGMSMSEMRSFCTQTHFAPAITGNTITVSAGNVGGQMSQVFFGGILTAFINFSSVPEVSFDVMAIPAAINMAKAAAPTPANGQIDVAKKLRDLAEGLNFNFVNNGVTVQLSNHYLCGTAIDQIKDLIDSSGIGASFRNQTLSIWPNKGYVDDSVVQIGPDSGMVGYPQFTPTGAKVKVEFNPEAVAGRKASITSIIAMAAGDWSVSSVRHELSTYMPGGPWFTTLELGGGVYASSN